MGQRVKPPVSGNPSLRNILGDVGVASAWSSKTNGGGHGVETERAMQEQVEPGAGKGKKGKGKQKQTLFTLGSFPT